MPTQVEVCAIQLPGRENRLREQPHTRLASLVEQLAEELEPYLDLPFALFGHSMGAWIAFTLARRLRQRHPRSPVHLFVSGRRAPQIPSLHRPIHALPDPEFIGELRRRYGGLPEAVLRDPELLELFLPVLRADLTLVETYTYTPEPPLACPISAFGGAEDPASGPAGLAAWQAQTTATFSMRLFPGGHFFVQTARTAVLAEIRAALAPALGC